MRRGSCRQSVGTCSRPQDRLIQLHLNQMMMNVTLFRVPCRAAVCIQMVASCSASVPGTSVWGAAGCAGVQSDVAAGFAGWFVDNWGLHGEEHNFPSPPCPIFPVSFPPPLLY